MTETTLFTVVVGCIKEFLNYAWKYWTVQQNKLCNNEFQTEGALTLKALAANESAILSRDSNSLSAYHSVRSLVPNQVIRWER